jgi:hypothetical protein
MKKSFSDFLCLMQPFVSEEKHGIQSSENKKRQKKKEVERERLKPKIISEDLKFSSSVLGGQVDELSGLCTGI